MNDRRSFFINASKSSNRHEILNAIKVLISDTINYAVGKPLFCAKDTRGHVNLIIAWICV